LAPATVPATGANLGTSSALVSPLASVAPARPIQPLVRPAPGVEPVTASPDSAPEDRPAPDLQPLGTLTIETRVPLPARALEAPAVPLALLPSWDDAINAFMVGEDELVLPAGSLPASTGAASDQGPSALESALFAGAAVVLWGAWEVRSRRSDPRRYRSFRGPSLQ
jgi:hypothetical protein